MDVNYKDLDGIYEVIDKYQTFLLTATEDADGDSVGAQIALSWFLKKLDKRVVIVNQKECPEKYDFLDGSADIKSIDSVNKKGCYDVGFVMDGGVERCGDVKEIFNRCKKRIIIDHHLYGSKEAYDFSLVDSDASSTCELIYILLNGYHKKIKMESTPAASIYLGIIFDTGSFAYSLTTQRTHEIASDLMSKGIDFSYITEKCIMEKSIPSLNLMKYLLQDINISSDGRIIWIVLSNKLIEDAGAKKDDMEAVVQQLSFVKGIDVSIFFKEAEANSFKVSFRSRGKVDVGRFCRELDKNGGGHARAAGCLLRGELKDMVENILKKLKDLLKDQ